MVEASGQSSTFRATIKNSGVKKNEEEAKEWRISHPTVTADEDNDISRELLYARSTQTVSEFTTN